MAICGQRNGSRGKRTQQRLFGVAHFHGQDAVAAQVLACRRENRTHRIQSIGAGGKTEPRLMPVLARQPAHFRASDVGGLLTMIS